LKHNARVSTYLAYKSKQQLLKSKAENFLLLRYSVQKQKALRELYYDYLVAHSRKRAAKFLRDWLSSTARKIDLKQSFVERTIYF
jgi:hypothetical protein